MAKNLGKKNYNENTKDIKYLQLQLCFLFQDVVDITGVGALAALEISLKNDPYNQENKTKIFTQPAQTLVLNPSKFETFLAFWHYMPCLRGRVGSWRDGGCSLGYLAGRRELIISGSIAIAQQ